MDLSDGVLADRWRQGDLAAAEALAQRYANVMGAVAYSVVHDATLAQDVVQESFLRALSDIRRLREAQSVGPWLVSITRNVAVDLLRSRRGQNLPKAAIGSLPRDPGQELARGELGDRIRQLVSELPQDQQEVFIMRYVTGMSYSEISRVLGIVTDAVCQKLQRARQRLQAQLREFLE